MTQPSAVEAHNRPETPLEPLYFEDQVVLEAGGLRLTIFYQEIPAKLMECSPKRVVLEMERLTTLRAIWTAVQNLKAYGRVRI